MNYEEFVRDTSSAYPKFELVEKRTSALMKVIDVLLKLITFGLMKNFMSDFTTTFGYTVYTPSSWESWSDAVKLIVLRHERVHMRQRKQLGSFWFGLSYLLLPVPSIWAYYRMKYEMEAYEETIRATFEAYGLKVFSTENHDFIIRNFTGASYFWTWPWRKRIEEWYEGVLLKLVK